jgi:hypothetical protein
LPVNIFFILQLFILLPSIFQAACKVVRWPCCLSKWALRAVLPARQAGGKCGLVLWRMRRAYDILSA